jgi:hypothetical protein
MKSVSSVLLAASALTMFFYAVYAVFQLTGAAFDRFYRGYIRQIQPGQYMQSVLLPLYGIFAGALIGTGFSVLADPPPGDDFRSGFIAIALIAAAFYFGMIVPLKANITYENRGKLLISVRIDRLKNEEWASDSKADVLETIEQDRAAIMKLSNDLNPIFFVLLAFLIASDADWLIFYHKVHAPTISVEVLVIAIAVSGIVAQYWAWPKALRIKLAELGSYRDQAEKLALPIPVNAAMIDHRRNRDLWVAAGGLIIGVILARAGGVLHRNQH